MAAGSRVVLGAQDDHEQQVQDRQGKKPGERTYDSVVVPVGASIKFSRLVQSCREPSQLSVTDNL